MEDNKGILFKSTTFYGLLLGFFWVIKFIFFIFGSWYPGAWIIYWMLAPLTIVFSYYMGKAYKILIGGKISFSHAWQFEVLLYFFAALVVSLMHYAFYRFWAPPGFIADSINQTMHLLQNMDLNGQMRQLVEKMAVPTPIQMTLQGIFNNVFYGIVLSIPIAIVLSRGEIKIIRDNNQEESEA